MDFMRRIVFAFLFFLCACASTPRVEDLSLDEKIGQLFIVDAYGRFMNEDSLAFRELQRQVRENHVGGVLWYASNVHDASWITRRLQESARVPLLVSADLESGIGMRFSDTTQWPWAMAVAATGEPAFAETLGRVTAIEAKAIGINHVLAPVADVNVDPNNPVINTRSFGEDPQKVARYVSAFIRGAQSQGVLATAKHFPGHGDTHVDSHRSLPVVNVDRARLDRVELVPFRAAIEAEVGSVMVGHLSLPALDPVLPASLSPRIIDGLLRHELGFDGLVVGDAFDMGGIAEHFSAGEAAVRAIEAGIDMIMKSPDTDAAMAAVRDAVRSGRISEARIDASVRRILAAKHRVASRVASQADLFRTIDTAEHRRLAAQIATRAITLVRSDAGALPLQREARIVVVSISDFPEVRNPAAVTIDEIAKRTTTKPASFLVDQRTRADELQPILDAAANADVVLLACNVRAISGSGRLQLPDSARALVERLPSNAKTIAVSFGSPYIARDLPSLRTFLCAYGVQPVMQIAAVKALFGEETISGKLPVTIP